MLQRTPIELSMAKVCKNCGASNVVMIARLLRSPACNQCGELLTISHADLATARVMHTFAVASGEFVKID